MNEPDKMISASNVNRILAVTIGGLGDAILFSPVLRALRFRYPQAEIELLLASRLAELAFAKASEINRTIFINISQSPLPLRAAKFLPFALRSRIYGGFDLGVFSTGLNPKLSVLLKLTAGIRNVFCAPNPPACETDLSCNLALARRFGENIDENDVFIQLNDNAWVEANKNLGSYGIIGDTDDIIAVYPSADLRHRPRWEISKLIRVITLIRKNGFRGKVVVLGSAEEGREWMKADTQEEADAVLAGKISITGSAALLRRCRLAVGNDGGLMHVAGAVGCPVVVVMTNTPLSYRPPGQKIKVIHSSLTCCTGLYPNRPKSCKRAKCSDDISVREVFEACQQML